MPEAEVETPFLIDSNTPIMEGRDGYYQAFLILRSQLGRLLSNEGTGITQPHPYWMTRLIISGITDEKERERILQKLEERKAYHETSFREGNARKELTADDKAIARIEACLDTLGDISTWYDNFVGVTQKNLWNEV